MKTHLSSTFLASAAFVSTITFAAQPGHAASSGVPLIADGIGGVVTGPKGPEAGVWVIAETEDTPTRFIKIVVTDDQGRYLIPELPKQKYRVWVRGYGLVDSKQIEGLPGKSLNLTAVPAPDAKAAAQYYPANYWFAMIEPPATNEFPGTGPKGNGIAPTIKTQQEWVTHLREGCTICHQLGDKASREVIDNSPEGWAERIRMAREDGDQTVGNLGRSFSHDMQNNMTRFGTQRGLKMFADWTQKIAKGEIPATAPPRPMGVERNAVITVWDWAQGRALHDEISADRRNPTVGANGRVYAASNTTGTLQWVDPVRHEAGEIPLPGKDGKYDINAYPHNPMMDQKGRIWLTDSSRGRQVTSRAEQGIKIENPLGPRASYCFDGTLNKFAKFYPQPGQNTSAIFLYDPTKPDIEHIPACYGTHHLAFGYDKDNTLYFTGDAKLVGWVNTRIWDETHDPGKSQGWCPAVLDTNGDGKITPDPAQWNELGVPGDPKKDTHMRGFDYGVDVHPKDGSVWFTKVNPYVPSGVHRFDPGANPPETCMSEYYEPPKKADGTYVAFDARGIGVDMNGIVHASFGSGKLGTFDRSKCKVMRGPTATGQHCPEGWTFYDIPGPTIASTDNVSADWFYLNWVDTYDTLGLGANVPLTVGSNSDSLIAMLPKTNQVVHFRVPYPMGFYSRGMDGRIDDPRTGWKGRGVWASMGTFPVWHQEGGEEGKGPQLIKFQVRPGPLAY